MLPTLSFAAWPGEAHACSAAVLWNERDASEFKRSMNCSQIVAMRSTSSSLEINNSCLGYSSSLCQFGLTPTKQSPRCPALRH